MRNPNQPSRCPEVVLHHFSCLEYKMRPLPECSQERHIENAVALACVCHGGQHADSDGKETLTSCQARALFAASEDVHQTWSGLRVCGFDGRPQATFHARPGFRFFQATKSRETNSVRPQMICFYFLDIAKCHGAPPASRNNLYG